MRVLITGSSGFLGRALAARLRARGHHAVPLVRTSQPVAAGTMRWDPAAGTIDPIAGVDAVVHLAGVGIGDRRWTEGHKARVLDSRVRGTALLCEALAASAKPPAVLVSQSGIDYYGHRGDEVLTEDSAAGTGFLAKVCIQWEAATGPAERAGIRVVRTRTGLVLDGTGGILPRVLLPFRVGLGGRLGSGRQWWSWIALVDWLSAIEHLIDADLAGPVNLTAPAPVPNAEFTRIVARVLGRPGIMVAPAPALRLALGSEMAHELLLGSKRVIPHRLTQSGFTFAFPDLDAALRAALAKR